MRAWLAHKIPRLDPERIAQMLSAGAFVDEHGNPLASDAAFTPNRFVFFHRDLPDETPPPGELIVLYRDERLVVLDKPHFTSTIPRGQHVLYSAVVRARRELDLPELAPAHRLDRMTAGVLLCTTERRWRPAYQSMFEHRTPRKVYEAVAGFRPDLAFPRQVESHIVKRRGVLRAEEISGEPPNAFTEIELMERLTSDAGVPLARYQLHPRTGKTHQLRIHLNSLGIPIVNDPFYPDLLDTALDDFSHPLQLLASELSFTDPIEGTERRFTSSRTLDAWSVA